MCIMIDKKVVSVLLILCLTVTAVAVPVGVTVAKTEVKTIVIDPGHGGMDAGVSSAGGVKESDLVLTISRILAHYLESGGFKVVLTRKNKTALTEGKFIKRTDMQKRLKIIERAKPGLVVSLHLNSFTDKSRRGIQVFYGKDDSKDFAKEMQSILNDEFNLPDVKRDFSALYADKYLLTESPCSAVIIECGFLSNPIDTENLLDEKYLHRLAYTIFQGIAVWWTKTT